MPSNDKVLIQLYQMKEFLAQKGFVLIEKMFE